MILLNPHSISLWYLATPYSKYKHGIEMAFIDAAKLTARLIVDGYKVYSPITHTHPIAIHGKIDPLDHKIWIAFDETMMRAAEALMVAQMEGWEHSHGIAHEIAFFKSFGKPVFYLDIETLDISNHPSELVLA